MPIKYLAGKPHVNDSNSDSSGDSSTSDEKEDCNEEEQLRESMTEPRNSCDGIVVLFQNKPRACCISVAVS